MGSEKWIAGPNLANVVTTYVGNRIEISFPYNKHLLEEVKMMQGARWHGFDKPTPRKIWSVENNQRNAFQIRYLRGENPFQRFIVPDSFKVEPTRKVHSHQRDLIRVTLYTRAQIAAAEPGLGKTLFSIEVAELSGSKNVMYVAPKNALIAIKREFRIWNAKVSPRMYTYEEMTKAVKESDPGLYFNLPEVLIFDESQGYMHATSQRSQAAKILADAVRERFPNTCIILLMTGTPSPKDPCGWYWQCEIACPGFLREGDPMKFRRRLSLSKMVESDAGGSYPEHITWLDDEKKCATCGLHEKQHDTQFDCLKFAPSINEIAKLSRRLKGLVTVKLKKDCLDLPPKIYQRIYCPPSKAILRAAKSIARLSPTVIQKLTRLRELSDGFQYEEHDTGRVKPCSGCSGIGTHFKLGTQSGETETCFTCGGTGKEPIFERQTMAVDCPKDEALKGLLDSHEGIGRLVIFAAYQASVDRVVEVCQQQGWLTIRVDGRGWDMSALLGALDPLDCFQIHKDKFPKIAFIGHPASAGVSLTLTASPSAVYYSNDYNAVSRMQSEDRIHRMSQVSESITIYDIIHLPTDELVLDNLQKKRELQAITMGDVSDILEKSDVAIGERI